MQSMTTFEIARRLAKQHFHVVPIAENSKWPPILKDFPQRATTDQDQIRRWWVDPVMGLEQGYNVGISTTNYNGSEHLIVVDIDGKDKDGFAEIIKLEFEGFSLPPTYTQYTPNAGEHLVYKSKVPVGQRDLAPGVNIRAKGGYIVGAGCSINGKFYTANDLPVADAPQWLVDRCAKPSEKKMPSIVPIQVNEERAVLLATEFLKLRASLSIEGASGDNTAFAVAARVRDFGVDPITAHELLLDHWNDRCEPPWSPDELWTKIDNAYQYSKDIQGNAAPEAHFTPVAELPKPERTEKLHPFEKLNKKYAFVIAGSGHHIIWETTDEKGQFKLGHLREETFHALHAAKFLSIGTDSKPTTRLWMRHKDRRTFHGFCFRPELDTPDGFYNLWRGFSVKPLADGTNPTAIAQKAVDSFLEHIEKNVCLGDEFLTRWVTGYLAHMVQKPWQKPETALVFKGDEGVGKTIIVKTMGKFFGPHYLPTSKKRYLTGDFNSHLENKILFVLEEACWAGDKAAESTLKDLITGDTIVIEHKGQEPFTVANCMRVVITSNEPWAIPAGPTNRRFAVFEVSSARIGDRDFFGGIQDGMDAGGHELLLRYLLAFDLKGIDLNKAPATAGLLAQKRLTMGPLQEWYEDSLLQGEIGDTDAGGVSWQEEIECAKLRDSFRRWMPVHARNNRLPSDRETGTLLLKMCPSIHHFRKRIGNRLTWAYRFPPLEQARREWEAYIGHKVEWDKEE